MPPALLLSLFLAGQPSLEERALSAYQRHDYAAAWQLYRAATRAHPENAGLWADLGLCLYHLDKAKQGEAADAERRAIAAAKGDAGREVRLRAYYNLDLIQGALDLPLAMGHLDETCQPRTDARCPGATLQVCAGERYMGGNGTGETVTYLGFRSDAGASEGEGPSLELHTDVSDFLISSRICSPSDAQGPCDKWIAELPREAKRRFDRWVAACVRDGAKRDAPPDEGSCAQSICADMAEGADADASHAAVQKLFVAKYEECNEQRRAEEERIRDDMRSKVEQCRVVHVDVCTRLVGMVCERDGKRAAEEKVIP
ncbi:MAG TPA: hypothetical protein VFA20_27755 [Myxococcaceae bacterium]|nr:hypothetical protein [Myxococcaceae bacterium]